MGVLSNRNDPIHAMVPESIAIWQKARDTKFSIPTTSQRTAYSCEVLGQVTALGTASGLWEDARRARMCALDAVQEFQVAQENEAIACRMRQTARQLTSAALHMSPPKDIHRIVAGSMKRERKEDFEEVEASLPKAVQDVQNFKKAKYSHESEAAVKVSEAAHPNCKPLLTSNLPALTSKKPRQASTTDTATLSKNTCDSVVAHS
jgi:hypothetical protein